MAGRSSLVCQHLENISRDVLEEYQDVIRQYVRDRQGVYALYRRGKLYYVGLARNLRMRLAHHLRDRHGDSWDRFSVYLTIGDSHLRELESLILRIVKPKGNKQKGKFAKSEDLKHRFGKDVRTRHRQQYDRIFGRIRVAPHVRSKRVSLKGRVPALAKYIKGPMTLRARYKGRLLKARVSPDGRIRFAKVIYSSPSLAGKAACKRVSCNGWTFWQYERAPGDWVVLDKLRKS
jgi:hypothetical protein